MRTEPNLTNKEHAMKWSILFALPVIVGLAGCAAPAGWTVAGWIAALVWSVTAIRQPAAIMLIGSPALRTAQPAAA
jgi:hypothetical protein